MANDDIRVNILADVAPFIRGLGLAAKAVKNFAQTFTSTTAAAANSVRLISQFGNKVLQFAIVLRAASKVLKELNISFFGSNAGVAAFAKTLRAVSNAIGQFGIDLQVPNTALGYLVGKLRQATAALLGFGNTAKTTGKKAAGSFSNLSNIFAGFGRSLKGIQAVQVLGQLQSLVFGLTTSIKNLGFSLGIISQQLNFFSQSLLKALGPIVSVGAELDTTLAQVQAVVVGFSPTLSDSAESARAAGVAFAALRERVLSLAVSTKFTATQISEAARFLGLAGLSANEVLKALPATLALAAAGSLELGRAADIATDLMLAFRLEVEDLNRVVDTLAVAAARSNTSVEQLAQSMKFVAPTASSLGVSIETTAALIGKLADQGLKGSLAGTALNNLFVGLTRGGKKLDAALSRLGLSFAEVSLTSNDVIDVIEKLQGLTPAERFAAFNARGARAFNAFSNLGVASLRKLQTQLEEGTFSALEIAQVQLQNTGGAILILKAQIERLGVAIFDTFKDRLQGTLVVIGKYVDSIVGLIKDNKELVAGFIQFGAAIAGIASGLSVLTGSVAAVVTIVGTFAALLGTVVAAILGIAATLSLLALPLGLFAAGFAVIVASFGAVTGLLATITASIISFGAAAGLAFAKLSEGIGKTVGGITRFEALVSLLIDKGFDEFIRGLRDGMGDLSSQVEDAATSLESFIGGLLKFDNGSNAFTRAGRALGAFIKDGLEKGLETFGHLDEIVATVKEKFEALVAIAKGFLRLNEDSKLLDTWDNLQKRLDRVLFTLGLIKQAIIAAVAISIFRQAIRLGSKWAAALRLVYIEAGSLALAFPLITRAVLATTFAVRALGASLLALLTNPVVLAIVAASVAIGYLVRRIYQAVKATKDLDDANEQVAAGAGAAANAGLDDFTLRQNAANKLKSDLEDVRSEYAKNSRETAKSIRQISRLGNLLERFGQGDLGVAELEKLNDEMETLRERGSKLGFTPEQVKNFTGVEIIRKEAENLEVIVDALESKLEGIFAANGITKGASAAPTAVQAQITAVEAAIEAGRARLEDAYTALARTINSDPFAKVNEKLAEAGIPAIYSTLDVKQRLAQESAIDLAVAYETLVSVLKDLPKSIDDIDIALTELARDNKILELKDNLDAQKLVEDVTGASALRNGGSIDLQFRIDTAEANKDVDEGVRGLLGDFETLFDFLNQRLSKSGRSIKELADLDTLIEKAKTLGEIQDKTDADSLQITQTILDIKTQLLAIVKANATETKDAEKTTLLLTEQILDLERKRIRGFKKAARDRKKAELDAFKEQQDNRDKALDRGKDLEIEILKLTGKESAGIRLDFEKKLAEDIKKINEDLSNGIIIAQEALQQESQARLLNNLQKSEALQAAAEAARSKRSKNSKVERAQLVDVENKILDRLLAQAGTARDILQIFQFLLFLREQLAIKAERQSLRALSVIAKLTDAEKKLEDLRAERARRDARLFPTDKIDRQIKKQEAEVNRRRINALNATGRANALGNLAGTPQFANVDPIAAGIGNALEGVSGKLQSIFDLFNPAIMLGNTGAVLEVVQDFAHDFNTAFLELKVNLFLHAGSIQKYLTNMRDVAAASIEGIATGLASSNEKIGTALALISGKFSSFADGVRDNTQRAVLDLADDLQLLLDILTNFNIESDALIAKNKLFNNLANVRGIGGQFGGDQINSDGDVIHNTFQITLNGIYDVRSDQFNKAVTKVIRDAIKQPGAFPGA